MKEQQTKKKKDEVEKKKRWRMVGVWAREERDPITVIGERGSNEKSKEVWSMKRRAAEDMENVRRKKH